MDRKYYNSRQPVIGSHDVFYSNDLGYEDRSQQPLMKRSYSRYSDSTHDSLLDGNLNPQNMQRTGSMYSTASSYENQLSPSDGYSSIAYFPYSNNKNNNVNTNTNANANAYYGTAPSYDYQLQSASSVMPSAGSYVPNTPRYGTTPQYPQMMTLDTPVSPVSTARQPSSSQNERQQFVCLHHGCNAKPFARSSDLKRHMDHVHGDATKLEQYYCDRKNCSRSEQGYKETLARMGRLGAGAAAAASPLPPRPSSSSGGGGGGGGNKDSGIGPFSRKDHFKAHLRESHREALYKRDPRSDPRWLDNKIVHEDWWRCPKCLARVHVRESGWRCGGCGRALEEEAARALRLKMQEARAEARARKTGEPKPTSSGSSSSRDHRR